MTARSREWGAGAPVGYGPPGGTVPPGDEPVQRAGHAPLPGEGPPPAVTEHGFVPVPGKIALPTETPSPEETPAPETAAEAAKMPSLVETPEPVETPAPAEMPAPGPAPAPAPAAPPRNGGHRKPAAPARRPLVPRKAKLAGALIGVAGVITAGFLTGFGKQGSPESTVQAFLLDWQQGNYQQAAAFTTGSRSVVAAQLSSAYSDLNSSATFLSLGPVRQHGDTASATFKATVDVDQGRHQWNYTGHLGLISKNGNWFVNWSPGVINPSLGPGDRLAVTASYPQRAPVTDSAGQSLVPETPAYHIGVIPGRLTSMAKTVRAFSGIAQLDPKQVLGEVRAAPPGQFLSLLTVDPATFKTLWPRLSAVPGVGGQVKKERLFVSGTTGAGALTGSVGTENSSALQAAGVAYEPGNTMGLGGLEQTYQDTLAGTPAASVVVVNSAGKELSTLWTAPAHAGTPVKTTLDSGDQAAATRALASRPNSGEIIAVDSGTGDIKALATHDGPVPLPAGGPLNTRIAPGMAFSIVSAAAMMNAGMQPGTPMPCNSSEAIGGQTFTYTGQKAPATLASDFARGCGTAFASMAAKLTPQQLAASEKAFGIGGDWDLPVQAFPGSAQSASAGAGLASQVTGTSGVLMSPLGMAAVAAEVDSGTGHAPVLVPGGSQAAPSQPPLSPEQLTGLRQMMRGAVLSGTAKTAGSPGAPVYGQAGVTRNGQHGFLSWFVGYRGTTAVAVLQAGNTPQQAAASLAGAFLSQVH